MTLTPAAPASATPRAAAGRGSAGLRQPVAPPPRPTVRARLDCTAAPDAAGRLRVRSTASGPLHGVHHPVLRGPDVLLVTSDSAGLAAGDAVDVGVRVAAGAGLVVSDPAPTQLLPGRAGDVERMTTRVEVAAGGRWSCSPTRWCRCAGPARR
ncbi:urease accessory protein UreD [Geodermatophilus chilensis]|uniref:urease accessory protein UreD n=1 Tax=Geodermatophilus chilensis TaxID=2035835 RepID=UPI0013000499